MDDMIYYQHIELISCNINHC